jgi:polyphosphate kinase
MKTQLQDYFNELCCPTVTPLGVANARTFDQTSNGGGIEGDLDVLITNGFTVNFTL